MVTERSNDLGIVFLRFVFCFTLSFSVLELFASYFSNSIILAEESIHMFADSISYGINLWAEVRSKDKANHDKAQYTGTLVSFLALMFTLIVVVYESIQRLLSPRKVNVNLSVMIGFGLTLSCFHAISLIAYFCGLQALHSHSHGTSHKCSDNAETSNVSSAVLHVFVDLLHSFLVVLTAVVAMLSGSKYSGKIDAIGSVILCFVILAGCVSLYKQLTIRIDDKLTYQEINVDVG